MQQYLWVRSDDSMTAGEAGVLTVHLRKAAGLLDADVFDKSDAYAVIRLGGQTHTSRVVDNSLNPEWGQVRTVHRVCRATYLKLLEVTWRAGAALTRAYALK